MIRLRHTAHTSVPLTDLPLVVALKERKSLFSSPQDVRSDVDTWVGGKYAADPSLRVEHAVSLLDRKLAMM